MTTVHIVLPDALAEEAARAGLLESAALEQLLREHLRQKRMDRMASARRALDADPIPALTPDEINAEIEAYRAEQADRCR